ncbi:MAG: dephospho-CoA kinase, partial [Candidatus Zixiibacteriota bacterium]
AVINADNIGREVVENNRVLLKKLARTFGQDLLTSAGILKRKRVAQIAFASQKNKRRLDQLVHPFLLKSLRDSIKRFARNHEVIVIDAALLLDWNLDQVADKVLLIHSGFKKRLIRLQKRGMNISDIKARQKWQLSYDEFRRRSDKVILNNSTKSDFEKKVRNWAREYFETN